MSASKEIAGPQPKEYQGKVQPGWREIPRGGMILQAGNAREFETGDWRVTRPVWIPENCIQCLFCWIYCPDAAVLLEDGKVVGFDYAHCKGCGICAHECPGKKGAKAIKMVAEAEAEEASQA